jgi:hypothetical protein
VCHGDVCTGGAQALVHDPLHVGDAAAFRLQFERVAAALENAEDVGNAGDGADRLEDRALDTGPEPTERNVKEERTRPCAPREVLDYAALERGLGLGAAGHFGTHGRPPAATRSRMTR